MQPAGVISALKMGKVLTTTSDHNHNHCNNGESDDFEEIPYPSLNYNANQGHRTSSTNPHQQYTQSWVLEERFEWGCNASVD